MFKHLTAEPTDAEEKYNLEFLVNLKSVMKPLTRLLSDEPVIQIAVGEEGLIDLFGVFRFHETLKVVGQLLEVLIT